MKVAFLGDIALNDKYIQLFKDGIDPFLRFKNILNENDIVIGNLECMPKGDAGENILKKPRLTTTVETFDYLGNLNLSLACLAHNHVCDHLEDGLKRALQYFNHKGIKSLGADFTYNEAIKSVIQEKNGIKLGFLNYVTVETNPGIPAGSSICVNIFELERCQNEIKSLKKSVNYVILLLHWGGRVENGLYPDWNQPKIARKLIDWGADLIIGHHSHTVQPYETYKGKYIFYSLGNFCFADHWFEGKFQPLSERNLISTIVTIDFTDSFYTVKTSYYKNNVTQYTQLKNYHLKIIFRNIVFKVISNYKPFWSIYYFNKRYLLPLYLFLLRKDLSFKYKIVRILSSIKRKYK